MNKGEKNKRESDQIQEISKKTKIETHTSKTNFLSKKSFETKINTINTLDFQHIPPIHLIHIECNTYDYILFGELKQSHINLLNRLGLEDSNHKDFIKHVDLSIILTYG